MKKPIKLTLVIAGVIVLFGLTYYFFGPGTKGWGCGGAGGISCRSGYLCVSDSLGSESGKCQRDNVIGYAGRAEGEGCGGEAGFQCAAGLRCNAWEPDAEGRVSEAGTCVK
jgi:hypothetical protein